MNREATMNAVRAFFVVTSLTLCATGLLAQTWLEDSFEDFADGTLDAAGQNIYVSREGAIRTIHRFDINQDGYLDLMFNNTHDRRSFIPATLATVGPDRAVEHSPLAVEGSRQVVFADLNRDGFLDVVFCPNASGVQTSRRFVTVIYGGEDGWRPRRSNGLLPVNSAAAVAVADLNADQWPDIVTLNSKAWLHGQPSEGRILRIYWGSEHGFLLTRYHDLGVEGVIDLAAADFDSDGSRDLAILTDSGAVLLYWAARSDAPPGQFERVPLPLPRTGAIHLAAADADGDGHIDLLAGTNEDKLYVMLGSGSRRPHTGRAVNAFPASHVTAGDLDGDQRPDLVLTSFIQNRAGGGEASGAAEQSGASMHVLWGGDDWNRSGATSLDIPYATASAIGDLDGDGPNDLAVAVHQGDTTYLTDSVILFGREGREFERANQGIPTEGALDVAITPSTDHHPARAVFAGSLGGTVGELVPVQVFWGAQNGFDAERQWEIPMRSGYESSAADFDADGYLDIFSPHYHSELTRELLPNYIYWGGKDGFAPRRRATLICDSAHDAQVGDFDHDGRLDLAVSCHTTDGDHNTDSKVFYNDGERFQDPRVQRLPTHGTHWMWSQDMGHIYHRRWEQTYESSVFEWDGKMSQGQLNHEADVPTGTELFFQVRSATGARGLEAQAWRRIEGHSFAVAGHHRALQYLAVLRSDNGDRYPILDQVRITLSQ